MTSYGIGGGVGSAAAKTESIAAGFGVTLAWPVCGMLVALAMVLADRMPPRGTGLEEDYSECAPPDEWEASSRPGLH
jgi:hypothetical protein